jgi:hypothetical protein
MKRRLALILAPLAIAGTLLGATAATAGATTAQSAPPSVVFYHS